MDEFIISGGGGHAKVLIGVLRRLSFTVLGYTDLEDRGPVLGLRFLGDDAVLESVLEAHEGCGALVGVGKIDASDIRCSIQTRLEDLGFVVPVVPAPTAVIAEDVEFGAGTQVLDGTIVNSSARTGRGCILNSGSIVEHDCRLGVNVHVAPGATVCGGASIGDHTMIGAGATIAHGVTICGRCVIGAGAVVITDIPTAGTYAGVPAGQVR